MMNLPVPSTYAIRQNWSCVRFVNMDFHFTKLFSIRDHYSLGMSRIEDWPFTVPGNNTGRVIKKNLKKRRV